MGIRIAWNKMTPNGTEYKSRRDNVERYVMKLSSWLDECIYVYVCVLLLTNMFQMVGTLPKCLQAAALRAPSHLLIVKSRSEGRAETERLRS